MKTLFSILLLSLLAPIVAEPKTNVLFIAVDDLRPELGCYGKEEILSPHIDKLAAQGTLFTRAYCQVAVCGASRASLMTGLRPTWKRFLSYNTFAEKDAPGARTVAEELKGAGYHCISNGKIFHHKKDTADRSWSEAPWKPEVGGASFLDPGSKDMIGGTKKRGPVLESPEVADNAYPDGQIADKTIADLKRMTKARSRFFWPVGSLNPTSPFMLPRNTGIFTIGKPSRSRITESVLKTPRIS